MQPFCEPGQPDFTDRIFLRFCLVWPVVTG